MSTLPRFLGEGGDAPPRRPRRSRAKAAQATPVIRLRINPEPPKTTKHAPATPVMTTTFEVIGRYRGVTVTRWSPSLDPAVKAALAALPKGASKKSLTATKVTKPWSAGRPESAKRTKVPID